MPKAKKLPSGSWNCRVFSHYEYRNGKRVMIKRSFTVDDPSPAGRKECERLAAAWAESKDARTYNIDVRTAILEYIDAKKAVLSPSTVTAYEKYLNNGAFDRIGAVRVRDLRQADVQRWISDFSRDHSPKYTKNVYMLYAPAVKMAGGPSFEITLPRARRKDIYTPTDAEISQLLNYCRDTGKRELLAAVLLSAFGSLRRSEICALTPDDIDGDEIRITKAMVRDPGGSWVIKEPKTETSSRRVQLPPFVIDALPKDGPFIVNCNPDALSTRFNRAIRFSGLPNRFTIHALRHYYVSAAHALRIADAYIQKSGGWRTDHVMKSHYRTTLSDVEQREREKLDKHTAQVFYLSTGHETGHKRRQIQ